MGELAQHNKAHRFRGQSKCGGCAQKVHVLIRGDLRVMRQEVHEKNPESVHPVDQVPGASARCGRVRVPLRGNTKQTATHDQSRSALYGNIWGKHAEVNGIVVTGIKDEGPNVEMSGASNELVVGVDSDRRSRTPARHGIAFPRSRLGVSVAYIVDRDLIPATAR